MGAFYADGSPDHGAHNDCMDDDWVRFLQWALPHLHMRWAGFRRVRRQVIRRVRRRQEWLGLAGPDGYREYLHQHPAEWAVLDGLCRVTVSRFYRDRGVFEALERTVLPQLARQIRVRGGDTLSVWSCGCASGEEPYTVAIAWELVLARHHPGLRLDILATDADPGLLERAAEARYPASSIKDLPAAWREAAFAADRNRFRLRQRFRRPVRFLCHDVRAAPVGGPYQLILCRNLAFTYFDAALQQEVAAHLRAALAADGVLVVGSHEAVPVGLGFAPLGDVPGLYRAC